MQDLRARLAAAQDRAARVRAAAFVPYRPTVAGISISPITLWSYTALIAFESPFVTGGPAGTAEIAAFVWIHSPGFSQHNTRGRRRIFRQVYRNLNPRLPLLNAAALVLSEVPGYRWIRRFTVAPAPARIDAAIAEIRRMLEEATAEIPTSDDRAEPLPFAFAALATAALRRELNLEPSQALEMPLSQVAQYLREITHHASRGKAFLPTKEEAEIWREHLGANPTPRLTPEL